ncbi:MAG: DUF4870 domain-containing protein [Ktedonobacterales bacterium]
MTAPQQPDQQTSQQSQPPQQPAPGAGFAGAAPAPPGAGYAPPYPPPGYAPYPPPGYVPYGPPPDNNENVLAGVSHLSIFFGALIVPLIIWLTTLHTSPYASRQAKQAFFFHLGYTVIQTIVAVIGYSFFFVSMMSTAAVSPTDSGAAPSFAFGVGFIVFLIMMLLLVGIGITAIVYGVYGAVQAFNGKPFHYPFLARI